MLPNLTDTLKRDEEARFERIIAFNRTIQDAKRLEARLVEEQNLFSSPTHAWESDTRRHLENALREGESYYSHSDQREHYKTKLVDIGNLPDSPAMWAALADQAVRRDEAHAARQQELFDKSREQLQSGDRLASYVTTLQRKTEQQQHVSDVLSDCIAKEVAIRHDPESDIVADIRMDRDNALEKANALQERHADAQRFLEARPAHVERQTAYRDLAAFAHKQGAGRAAVFVEQYGRFKAAQHDARIAEIGGNGQEIEQTKARLAEVRAEAVKAKESVKTSEIAALNRAMAARLENPRVFTEHMQRRKDQDSAKAVAEKSEAEKEQTPAQTERRGVSIWTRKENIANLRAAGFEDTDTIRAAAKNTAWSERAMAAKASGFKDEQTIFALAQHEKPFEKAMALKAQGVESQRQIAVVAMRDAPKDDTAARLRAGNDAARGKENQTGKDQSASDCLRANNRAAEQDGAKGFAAMKNRDQGNEPGQETSVSDSLRANNRAAEQPKPKVEEEALTR